MKNIGPIIRLVLNLILVILIFKKVDWTVGVLSILCFLNFEALYLVINKNNNLNELLSKIYEKNL
jgi:hypothetical protein